MDNDLKKIIYDEVYDLFYEREFYWEKCGRFDSHGYACNQAAKIITNAIERRLSKYVESDQE